MLCEDEIAGGQALVCVVERESLKPLTQQRILDSDCGRQLGLRPRYQLRIGRLTCLASRNLQLP